MNWREAVILRASQIEGILRNENPSYRVTPEERQVYSHYLNVYRALIDYDEGLLAHRGLP